MKLRSKAVWISALVLLAFGSGCATSRIRSSDRRGMLDQPKSRDDRSLAQTRPLFKKPKGATPAERVRTTESGELRNVSVRRESKNWRWPVSLPEITSSYGVRGREAHEGVDLKAAVGTPVFAAASGKVLYAGQKITGYGNIVVLRHENKVSTIYAHNSKVFVKPGQDVIRGQRIALSGATGRVTGPHVHFEIRDGTHPINPEDVMPRIGSRQLAQYSSKKRRGKIN